MLAYYASRLNGVELNGSFYRMPPASTLEHWAAGVPPEFRFCMKANRALTYSADAFDRVGVARSFGERMAPLGDRLGPILLQFPPVRKLNPTLLDALLGALVHVAAVEFRDDSWFVDDTYRVLREHGAALVITDEEKWPRAPRVEVGPLAYYRLRRGYTDETLRPWIGEISSAVRAHEQVHVYFKHFPESPALALRLLEHPGSEGGARSGSRSRRSRP